eukprot:CAMPEP_0172712882 /NCGR_PEP_ID=MMETSP1074-20121228/61361_1 /TAXON_ID=2916 /ORGANISM="Ceratium fusus, Strain PA161109" /LENGTH=128 /DNA_ID=CAMNT_0013536877 /DNA_START=39 /DNA_END=422 /DNA_ORIENTATION=+
MSENASSFFSCDNVVHSSNSCLNKASIFLTLTVSLIPSLFAFFSPLLAASTEETGCAFGFDGATCGIGVGSPDSLVGGNVAASLPTGPTGFAPGGATCCPNSGGLAATGPRGGSDRGPGKTGRPAACA